MANTSLGPYHIGEKVTLTATFDDTVTLEQVSAEWRAPGANEATELTVAEGDGDNEFVAQVEDVQVAGDHWYGFKTTSGASEEGVFHVLATQLVERLVHPFTTVERCRDTVSIRKGVKTEQIQAAINAYSRAIANYTGREFLPLTPAYVNGEDTADPVEREFLYDGTGYLNLEPFEAREITGLSLRQGTLTQEFQASDWFAGPPARSGEGTYFWLELPDWCSEGIWLPSANLSPQWWRGRRQTLRVVVEGRWGAGIVPEDVRTACEIAVANRFRNPEGMARRAYGEGDFSPHLPDLTEIGLGMSLPPDARALLGPYRRPRARMRRGSVTTA